MTNAARVEHIGGSAWPRSGVEPGSLELSDVSENESQGKQNDALARNAAAGHPTHDGLLIVDSSGKIEPLGQSSSRAWQVPQGGKTMPLNQRFAHRWRIPQRMLDRPSKDNDLRHALDKDHLTVHFQPEADVQTGCIVGMEALVRWQHPRRGLILPDEFIPLAERTGFIVRLGEWSFEELVL